MAQKGTPLEMRAGVLQWPETNLLEYLIWKYRAALLIPVMFSGRKCLAPSVEGDCMPVWTPGDCGVGVGRALLSGTLFLCTKADRPKPCN